MMKTKIAEDNVQRIVFQRAESRLNHWVRIPALLWPSDYCTSFLSRNIYCGYHVPSPLLFIVQERRADNCLLVHRSLDHEEPLLDPKEEDPPHLEILEIQLNAVTGQETTGIYRIL